MIRHRDIRFSILKSVFNFCKCFLFVWVSASLSLYSQNSSLANDVLSPTDVWEAGLPHIQNFRAGEYKNSPQNWGFTEGADGFLYAANTGGVLQYDGTRWNTIPLANKGLVRSLALSSDKKIYVGGVNELGYLASSKNGQMKYYSLKEFLEDKYLSFRDVWATVTIANDVYFSTPKYLFRWDGTTFMAWEAQNVFGSVFKVRNKIYIDSKGVGIHKLEGDALLLINDSDTILKQRAKTLSILPYNEDGIMFVNARSGLFKLSESIVKQLDYQSNDILKKQSIYQAIKLSTGDYAIATTRSGLFIIDGVTGSIIKRIGKQQGISSDVLYTVYEDRFGALWVGGDNGVSRIDWASPFRKFDVYSGLEERVRSVSFNKGRLLVDSKGLYILKKSMIFNTYQDPTFERINSAQELIEFMVPYGNNMLTFDSKSIHKIDAFNKSSLILDLQKSVTAVAISRKDSTRLFVGTLAGELLECTYIDNVWTAESLLNIGQSIEGIVEQKNGDLWLQTYIDGLYLASNKTSTAGNELDYSFKKYDTIYGLPSLSYNFPYSLNNEIHVTAQDGMYIFNNEKDFFEKHELLNKQYDKAVDAYGYIGSSSDGTLYQTVRAGFENKIYTLSDNILTELQEYNRYTDFSTYSINFLENIILFSGPEGILAFDSHYSRPLNRNFSTRIRGASVLNDTITYSLHSAERIELPYKQRNLNFKYTLPYYNSSEGTVYQSYLQGFDEDWSQWSSTTEVNYTNIPAGEYTFKVRSKNIFNEAGDEDSFSFIVEAPWYSTWWAYVGYGVMGLLLFLLFSKWRSRKLKKQNEALEKTITERTLEIHHKNEILNHQTEKLVELNEAKTRLYSNISHEFRTPLTVILGMTDRLKENYQNKIVKDTGKSLEMIRRNGKNLLHLVNELLDLAKVESGAMELNLVQTDVVPFVKYFSESFHSLAESKKINLTVYSEIDALLMDVDVNKLGAIISNLLSNAVKFTSENGKIIVHLNKSTSNDSDTLIIKVQDNGKGLAKEELEHLFDRFYQATSSLNVQQTGTGIGLSLTEEFVRLMNGDISVDSVVGKGTTFTVQIPISNKASKNDKLALSKESLVAALPPTYKKELSLEETTSHLPLLLIIEDNIDVAHYLETCLQDTYQTMHAIDGQIGVEMAYKHIPDIIISDVMMPHKNGYEVCATLKEDERTDHIPIILLTAKVTTEDRLIGLSQGADAYLAKPFNKEELFTRLDQLILVRKKLISKLEKNGFSGFLKDKEATTQNKFLQQVIHTVLSHLDTSDFGPTALAEELHLSESQIYRKLKAITDRSTAVFIRSVRLQKAKELIQSSSKTISEISYEVGFNDPSWFSKAFKEEFGVPPSDISR